MVIQRWVYVSQLDFQRMTSIDRSVRLTDQNISDLKEVFRDCLVNSAIAIDHPQTLVEGQDESCLQHRGPSDARLTPASSLVVLPPFQQLAWRVYYF